MPSTELAVNFAGYLRAELGLGEAARGYVQALQTQGIGIHFVDVSDLCSTRLGDRTLDLPAIASIAAPHWINLIHINPDNLTPFVKRVGTRFYAGHYNIGIWAWETHEFPRVWWDHFDRLDEIWVGSSFMADAIARVSPIPVLTVPHVIRVPAVTADRRRFDLPEDEFIFLFSFDFNSTPARKNPQGTLAAFRRAFDPAEPVRLVFKSINGENRPQVLAELKKLAAGLRVSFIDATLDSVERYRLLSGCDCFISLHRAEGFGLSIAEAMALGKPVIATGWSGNLDFTTPFNALLVPYELRRLPENDPPYPAGTVWAEPDVDAAAELMRRIREDGALARRLGARARADIATHHGLEAVGERLRKRLEFIRERRGLTADRRRSRGRLRQTPARPLIRPWLQRLWRGTLAVVPARFHPWLYRMAAVLRQRLPASR